MISKLKRNSSVWLCVLVGKARSMNLTRVSPRSASAVLSFFPRRDVSDLDQPCLSTSAGHKGVQAKLFILTSFQQNKPCALGASVPPRSTPTYTHPLGWPAAVSLQAWPQPQVRLPERLGTRKKRAIPERLGHCRHLFYHVLSQSEERDQWSTSPNRWQ